MNRHTRSALAVLATGALLTSCGFGGDSGGGGGDGSDGGSTTLELLVPTYSDATQGLWDDMIADFEAENPDITVNLDVQSWDNINDVISTRIQGQDIPDILNIDAFAGYVNDDLLYPASEVLSQETIENFQDSFVENASMGGEQYGLPMIASVRQLFYNADVLEEAGVSEPPATWDELLEAATTISEAEGDAHGYGMPLGSEEAQAETAIFFFGGGGTYGDENEITLNTPENVEAAQFMQEMIEAGVTQPDPGATDRTPLLNVFGQGQIGMMIGLPPFIGQIEESNPEMNLQVAPIPTQDGEPFTLGVADHLMAFDKGEDKQEAIQAFLEFFYQDEQYLNFVETEGFLPVTESGGEALADDEDLAPFIEALPDAQFYPSTNDNWSAAQGALQSQIGQLAQGADPQDLLDQLQQQATSG
ncbi:MAG TPA: extracellular solute-binding protein [Jiangellaceae bacterium]|nr:extracellular solute-binding protein [Jiangellaceae bacterium]